MSLNSLPPPSGKLISPNLLTNCKCKKTKTTSYIMESKVTFGFNWLYLWVLNHKQFPDFQFLLPLQKQKVHSINTQQQKLKGLAVQQNHRNPLSIWDIYVAHLIWLFWEENVKASIVKVLVVKLENSSSRLLWHSKQELLWELKQMQSSFFWWKVDSARLICGWRCEDIPTYSIYCQLKCNVSGSFQRLSVLSTLVRIRSWMCG